MAIDVGLPSEAHNRGVSKAAAKGSGGRSERVLLALLGLVQVVWVAAVVYGAFQAYEFLRGLL